MPYRLPAIRANPRRRHPRLEQDGVAPGPIGTPLQVSGGASQEKLKKFGDQTPLESPGEPADLASIYVQLTANDASFATGQVSGICLASRPNRRRRGRPLPANRLDPQLRMTTRTRRIRRGR
jgi:hypothetical protein